uniref:Chemokine interleukin-8-like domain-containing protein n=1 Tax=Anser brachyrhynchus TaxID=132585 RepID=A0A8B9BQE0_9AVES
CTSAARSHLCSDLAEAVPPAPGAPLAGELRCRCVQAVTEVIPPRRLAGLELVPAGPHCAVPEVIATTKAGRTLCLSPSAPWVQLLVTRLLRRGIPLARKKLARRLG